MTRRILSFALTALLVNVVCVTSAPAVQQPARDDKAANKSRKEIKRVKKWNSDDPVKVTLHDGTKIRGHIIEATDDHFVVTDDKTRQSTNIDYAQVKKIDVGIGRKMKIALGIAAGVLIIAVVCAYHCKE
jgi:hypothetical protein